MVSSNQSNKIFHFFELFQMTSISLKIFFEGNLQCLLLTVTKGGLTTVSMTTTVKDPLETDIEEGAQKNSLAAQTF